MLIRPETATVLVATCHDATQRTGGTPRLLTTKSKDAQKFSARFQQMRTYSRGGNPRRIYDSEIWGLPTWMLACSDTRRRSSFRAIARLPESRDNSAVMPISLNGLAKLCFWQNKRRTQNGRWNARLNLILIQR